MENGKTEETPAIPLKTWRVYWHSSDFKQAEISAHSMHHDKNTALTEFYIYDGPKTILVESINMRFYRRIQLMPGDE